MPIKTALSVTLIIIILVVILACSSTPEPTLAPLDTTTPVPTDTTTPTPDVSATVEAIVEGLTGTRPTSIPTDTPRPLPTTTTAHTPDVNATVEAIVEGLTGTRPTPPPTLIAVSSFPRCETQWFIDRIVALSKESEVQILKIYSGAEQLERTDLLLRCVAEAKFSRGDYLYLIYHYELDRDGDAFIGYELSRSRPEPVPTPTATPAPTPIPTSPSLDWIRHTINSYSVEIPADWEKAFENMEERGGIVVFLDSQKQIQLRVFHFYFEEGTHLIALQDVVNTQLSSDSEETNYTLTNLHQSSSSTMRSEFTYKSSLMSCDVKAYGLHVLLPKDIFFVSVRICSFATSEYDAAFIERVMEGFSYLE